MKSKLWSVAVFLLITMPLGVEAQTDSALILSLQKQILQLLTQIQTLQQEVSSLKSEAGFQVPATLPVSEAEEAQLPEFTRSLSLGARGDDVRKLQEFLARDKEIYPEGLATGFYGPRTAEAVKRWQKKNNLEAVGVVGPKTISRLKELGRGVVRGLMEQGTPSGIVPPGLMTAPGVQKQMATATPPTPYMATTTPPVSMPATTTPAIPAEPAAPATPAQPTQTPAIPATPATSATPAVPASSSSQTTSGELKVTYPNGGETWYKGNSYTITWQNPLANGFTGDANYRWVVGLKRGNTSYGADANTTVPVTQSSVVWNQWSFPDPNVSVWTGQTAPLPNANDYKAFVSLLDLCASQVGGTCPSANISITPSGGIDYSDGYFTATDTPPTAAIIDATPPAVTLAVGYPNLTAQTQPVYVGFNANEEVKVVYEYGLTSSYGSTLNVWDNYWTGNGIYLPTLSSGTTYHIRAKATDRAGNIGYSQDYTFTTEGSTNTVPTNASAVTGYINGEIVNINWTDNSNNETSFDVYRRSSGLNVTPGAWAKIASAYSNMNNQADFPGAGTWEYRVDACNSAGCASNSGTVQLTVSSSSGGTATTTSAVLDSLDGLLKKLRGLLR